jgi:hypothetical protein
MQQSASATPLVCILLVVVLAGCPAPTPGERIQQLGGRVTQRGGGVVNLDLAGANVTDKDIGYIHGFCSNDSRLKSMHTLDLSDTAVTDKAIEFMVLQHEFPSGGLEVLVIRNTAISDSAIEKFRAKFPDCRVIR